MKIILVLSLLLFTYMSVEAQIGGASSFFDARSTGMGNSFTAASRGIFAVGKNPANMVLNESGTFEVQTNLIPLPLPSMNLGAGTDFLSLKDYNYFFGGVPDPTNPSNKVGRLLTPADKERLSELLKNGGNVFTDFSLPLLNLYLNAGEKAGSFALTANDRFVLDFTSPKDLSDLALNGNADGSVYNFSDAKVNSWWLRAYSLSYSRSLNDLFTNVFKVPENLFQQISFGFTVKYVQGFAYVGSDYVNASIETKDNSILASANVRGLMAVSTNMGLKYSFDSLSTDKKSSFTPFPSAAGSGLGFDLGFTARMNDVLTVGFSITDIGSLNWNNNAAEYIYNTTINLTDPSDKAQMDSIKDNSKEYTGRFISGFSTSLPTALHIGAAYQLDKAPFISYFPGSMLLVVDFHQGFNDMPGNTTKSRVGLGIEWKPMNWIPFIRTGISLGGRENFNWTFGLGINAGIFDLGIATKDVNYFFSNDLKRVSIALDTRWKF
ncbi:MAG: DUF5723 family protein [Ignavibacteriales bacterium]